MHQDYINQNFNEPIRVRDNIIRDDYLKLLSVGYPLDKYEYHLLRNHDRKLIAETDVFKGALWATVIVVLTKLIAFSLGHTEKINLSDYIAIVVAAILYLISLAVYRFGTSERKKLLVKLDKHFKNKIF